MTAHLRKTRRGWMVFRAAPDDAAGGGGPAEKKKDEADPAAATPAAIDYKAKLLALLDLDETADETAIDAKSAEVKGAATKLPELETSAGDATARLAEANAELERVRAEYQTLFERDQEANKAKQEAEVDAILEQFSDRLTDEKAKARIRTILVSDREAGTEILNGLPKAAAAAATEEKKTDTPPAPKHDPAAGDSAAPSDEEIATAVSARVKELQKKFPGKAYNALFTQAEKEVRAELSAAATA